MKDPNAEYWSEEYNDQEDLRRQGEDPKPNEDPKSKYNRKSFIGPLIVFLVILIITLITVL